MGYCPLWSTSYIQGLLLPELVSSYRSWGRSVYILTMYTLCSELGYRECIAFCISSLIGTLELFKISIDCIRERKWRMWMRQKANLWKLFMISWGPTQFEQNLITYILTYLQTKYRITLLWQTNNSKLSSFWSGVARWKNWRNAVSILAPSWKNC